MFPVIMECGWFEAGLWSLDCGVVRGSDCMKKMETVLTELYFFVIFFCFFYKKTEKILDKVVEIRMINQSI